MIREQVRVQMAALWDQAEEMSGVSCAARFTGTKANATQMLYATGTTGEVEFPYAMGGDKTSRDTFDITWLVIASGLRTVDECAVRAQEIAAAAVQVIASTGLTLDEFVADGEKVCEVGPFTVTDEDGDTTNGPLARTRITVSVETQTL